MKFSILICAVPSRIAKLTKLLEKLNNQIKDKLVEVLVLYDNKKRSVGAKRNSLLNMAQGEYIAFIDDDDTVADNYIDKILETIDKNQNVDVINFTQATIFADGRLTQICTYGLTYEYVYRPAKWRGKPAHTMVWRREVAIKGIFPDSDWLEDRNWVDQVCKVATTEVQIPDILYFYRVNKELSEALPKGRIRARE